MTKTEYKAMAAETKAAYTGSIIVFAPQKDPKQISAK